MMKVRFSILWRNTAVAASVLALAACGGAETDQPEPAASETAETKVEPAASPAAKTDAAGSAKDDSEGPGDFKETVKTARCKVYDPGGEYDGPCEFKQWGGASFSVNRTGNAEFFSGITEVVVEVDKPGVAGGSIRQNGDLNAIGTMERHSDDQACWSSADFTVCAY